MVLDVPFHFAPFPSNSPPPMYAQCHVEFQHESAARNSEKRNENHFAAIERACTSIVMLISMNFVILIVLE